MALVTKVFHGRWQSPDTVTLANVLDARLSDSRRLSMQTWWNVFISWVPFLLLLAFWFYFMKKMKTSRQGQLLERSFQHMERVEALLERIAASLDQQRSR